ncbi:hypothetical protein LIER_13092 [Lithospermum erythrorhizon]|uniref:Uncharacterized protein n=1 Tax=Lithospermum erythrorhizon TaxID=34254 RepID=A0AAV3PUC9_LITER
MKCFTSCFQTSKYKKLTNLRNKTASKDLVQENCKESQCEKQEKEMQLIEVPIDLIAESRDEYDKQLNASSRKKVTFNVNVQIHEVTTESLVKNLDQSKEEREVEDDTFSDSITSSSSFITYPPSQSLKTSRNSNEECEDMKLNESDLADDANEGGEGDGNDNVVGDHKGWLQEEFSDSLFSISLDSKKHTVENDLEKEVSSPFKKSVHNAVLNPVDGLIQLKVIKTKATLLPSMNQTENENVNMERQHCKLANEVAVDASLSSWLLDSEKNQKSKNVKGSSACDSSGSINSSNRAKHRPILGEIYVEEINQLSNCSSPKGGKNETPKMGTVGSYWKHTGQATSDSASSSSCRGPSITSSKCRDQGEVKRNSTPFQIRLERALEGCFGTCGSFYHKPEKAG